MPSWSLPALAAAACIALHYLTLRAASGRIDDALGALCLEGTAAIGILLWLVLRASPQTSPATSAGFWWSCVSGLCISGATTLLFTALRKGGPVAGTGTLVLGGGVTLSALVAPLFFAETFTLRRGVGVGLGVAAMVVLATER
jgi:uncharacterized membrane protein